MSVTYPITSCTNADVGPIPRGSAVRRRPRVDSTYAVATDFATSVIGRALHEAHRDDFTGALHLGGLDPTRVYCFEGQVYAAQCDAFAPQYAQRLRSGGRLGADADLATEVAGGRLAAEDLAVVHQEAMLALLGRLAEVPDLEVARVPRETTGVGCTLPIAWEPLAEVMRLRQSRMLADLQHVGGTATAEVTVQAVGAPPAGVPEELALWTALGQGSELDVAAATCGFTRAEALHLAARLIQGNRAIVTATLPRKAGPPAVPEGVMALAGRGGRLHS